MAPKSAALTLDNAPLNLQDRVQRERSNLIGLTESVFLGHPDALNQLTWFYDGHESFVTKKVSTDSTSAKSAASQTAKPVEPIPLSLIAWVTRNDTFLVPDGNYDGPTTYTRSLGEVKLTVALGSVLEPELSQLHEDFDTAYSTLTMLKKEKARPDCKEIGSIGVSNYDNHRKIKLRHKVFTLREDDEYTEDDTNSDQTVANQTQTAVSTTSTSASATPASAAPASTSTASTTTSKASELELAGYPVKSPAAKSELADMIAENTHDLDPLPAYEQLDIHYKSRQLLPSQYSSHLEGALVVVHFLLSHIHIAKDNKDCFTADVYSILVIDPLTNRLSSPRKMALKRKAGNDYPFPSTGKGKPKAV
ncbi:hypothetical protein EV360DRAFT_85947 [Lentinula raphanica]|nr:hypothetical protein EV360DRAFT_85947 [Lentinula raphanica]